MLAAAPRALRLVTMLVPAVAFGMPALATVGALMLDAMHRVVVVGHGTPQA